MYDIVFTSKMKKDVKLMKKRNKNLNLLVDILDKLAHGEVLPTKNKDHQLSGSWQGFRECHIEPDWLLIYRIDNSELILFATSTGSHSDLFDM